MISDETLGLVAFLSATMVVFYLIFEVWVAQRRAHKFAVLRNQERTRSAWADSRDLLTRLIVAGKVSPRSKTVQVLYPLQTFILRHPDRYEDIAAELDGAFDGNENLGYADWSCERESWPPEMTDVLRQVEVGCKHLIVFYPTSAGEMFRFALKRAPRQTRVFFLRMARRLVNVLAPRSVAFRVEQRYLRAVDRIIALVAQRGEQTSLTELSLLPGVGHLHHVAPVHREDKRPVGANSR